MITRSSHSTSSELLPNIQLTETESKICNLLKDYVHYYNSTSAYDPSIDPLTLRITGGWVRDKLLGQGSHDLDIAINIMTGEEFARGLNEYLLENYGKYGIKPHSIHKIDKNPEKSKHLETATTKLFGVEIDFVNLRSEEYTETSRIPIVNFGTPEQDALRRDATLNALFYNIASDQIEDYTHRGLKDLKEGVLKTPLPPRQTFLDDPLRVLRLIRFASRFNFKIDNEVLFEMNDPEINLSFNSKISRERIGVEMEKILNGSNPLIALKLIQISNLENVIFFWHGDQSVIEFNEQNNSEYPKIINIYKRNGPMNRQLLTFLKNYDSLINNVFRLRTLLQENRNFCQNFILASTLIPASNLKIISLPKKKMNNTMSLVESVVREGLKFSKNDAAIVSKCVDSIQNYQRMMNKFFLKENFLKRSELGTFLRDFNGTWEIMHFTSLVDEYLKSTHNAENDQSAEFIFRKYELFYDYIIDQDLVDCHNLKPLLDGKKLLKSLEMKAGPWLGKANSDAIIWQLDNPHGSSDELLAYIKENLPTYL
ncbi:hypothetical protein KAFR_0B02540 [Kazachstania africana CBS 2517]|uniref:CCA tRNA nucleotidyltransferase, mitochondrial n=1 Tax=Kazachstania africana (strain ATCC 22294 / BCRC 22015 / CBS 2517 / CECT 1963 / NBRC 1671 / NRRL Y-8276) TaxID=1071382 RepID=H2AQA1_KAZAF|nr:hypothetical protein KAFR_0B02540 [Kazachstania africana CBS 2517]CCF56551.1 hypothetical protein KAFR_0B02540 [Kazachstania africana CBS 2517]